MTKQFNELYHLFNAYETPREFSEYLNNKLVPVAKDETDEERCNYSIMFGNIMKSTLYYCYYFYTNYNMDIEETLSSMQFQIDADHNYDAEIHEKNLGVLLFAIETYINKFL